jgi:hypothetical protein
MRHRNQRSQANQLKTTETAMAGARATLTEMLAPERVRPGNGRHAKATDLSSIPTQRLSDHDAKATITELATWVAPVEATPVAAPVATPSSVAPETARWRASHLPRVLAAVLLALALVGTAMLGARFFEVHTSDSLVSLAISTAVVVVLWAMLIASTPQEVTLEGSMLTVHNRGGHEHFDLADGLQPVDLVGDPRSSKWALLLHRADRTSVVLRRHDVVATGLDPIVRHYRTVADQRFDERSARFTR